MYCRKILIIACLIFLFAASCSKEGASSADGASGAGKGGSMARFTIAGNYLYLADWNTLRVFDITDPSVPVEKPQVQVGFGVETIFPYKDKLFIGAVTGMYIYSIANPAAPVKLGSAIHMRSCDPVVSNDTVSYVTLQGSARCGPAESGLYIYDIRNISNPSLLKLLPLYSPYGLGLVDSVVFVCQGNNGLTAINIKKPTEPKIMYTKNDGDFMDVIPYDNMLICYVKTGLLIYDISDLRSISKIGEINN
jgi:hypothetical protein